MGEVPDRIATPDDVARQLGRLAERERSAQLAAATREPGIRSRQRGFAEDLSEIAVSSDNGNPQSLGPSVELKVPQGGATIWIVGQVSARNPDHAERGHVWVSLGGAGKVLVALVNNSFSFNDPYYFVPDPAQYSIDSPHGQNGAGSVIVRFLDAGTRTCTLQYSGNETSGTGVTFYSHRRLAVGIW